MRAVFIVTVLAVCFGCASERLKVTKDGFTPNWKTIAIMPFYGEHKTILNREFSYEFTTSDRYLILDADYLVGDINKYLREKNTGRANINALRVVAMKNKINAFFYGEVYTKKNRWSFDANVLVKLIDVDTGKVVATTKRRESGLLYYDEEDVIRDAAKLAIKDMRQALVSL